MGGPQQQPAGLYYWSVQAIDHAFAGSAFAPEASFAIAPDPEAAPLIPAVRMGEDRALALTLLVHPKLSYLVEVSSDLEHWTLWRTVQSDEVAVVLTDPALAMPGKRFYRARREEAGAPPP